MNPAYATTAALITATTIVTALAATYRTSHDTSSFRHVCLQKFDWQHDRHQFCI